MTLWWLRDQVVRVLLAVLLPLLLVAMTAQIRHTLLLRLLRAAETPRRTAGTDKSSPSLTRSLALPARPAQLRPSVARLPTNRFLF